MRSDKYYRCYEIYRYIERVRKGQIKHASRNRWIYVDKDYNANTRHSHSGNSGFELRVDTHVKTKWMSTLMWKRYRVERSKSQHER